MFNFNIRKLTFQKKSVFVFCFFGFIKSFPTVFPAIFSRFSIEFSRFFLLYRRSLLLLNGVLFFAGLCCGLNIVFVLFFLRKQVIRWSDVEGMNGVTYKGWME